MSFAFSTGFTVGSVGSSSKGLKVGTEGGGGGGGDAKESVLSGGRIDGFSVLTLLGGARGVGDFFHRFLIGEASPDEFTLGSETEFGIGLPASVDWIPSETFSILVGGANSEASSGVAGILCSTGLEESEFNVGLGS